MIILPMDPKQLHSRQELLHLKQAFERKRQKQQHNKGKQQLPQKTARSDTRVASTETNADGGEGSGTKCKSPVPSAGDESDVNHVEPGAGQRGGGAGKPMEERRERRRKPGTWLRLVAEPAVGEDGPERAELVFHLSANQTEKILLDTERPLEEFLVSCGPQLQCRFDRGLTNAFIITVAHDATREGSPQQVLLYNMQTQQEIALITVHTYPADAANSSEQPADAADSSEQPADAANSSKQPADAAKSSKQPADAAKSSNLKTLGLSYGASQTQIKEAFKQKVRQVHPDKTRDESGDAFRNLHAAYVALCAQNTAPAADGTSP